MSDISQKGMAAMRVICIIIGAVMVLLGVYFKVCRYSFDEKAPGQQECGQVALVVSCDTEEELARAAKLPCRVTVAIPIEKLAQEEWGSFALRQGLEVIAAEPKEHYGTKAEAEVFSQMADTAKSRGARGLLLFSSGWQEDTMFMTKEHYVLSCAETNGTLQPDYVLSGADEAGCTEALAQVCREAGQGRKAIVLYEQGQELPLEEAVSRLEAVQLVTVSGLLQ